MLGFALLVVAFTSSACREQQGAGAAGAGAASASVTSVGLPSGVAEGVLPLVSRELGGEASFDLVALPEGAALAVGEPAGKLSVLWLDRRGVARGEPSGVRWATRAKMEYLGLRRREQALVP